MTYANTMMSLIDGLIEAHQGIYRCDKDGSDPTDARKNFMAKWSAIRDIFNYQEEPAAKVDSDGFLVECGDMPLESGMLLYVAPLWIPVPFTED